MSITQFTLSFCGRCDHKCLNPKPDGKGKVRISPTDKRCTLAQAIRKRMSELGQGYITLNEGQWFTKYTTEGKA
jgi:hypothetical protein